MAISPVDLKPDLVDVSGLGLRLLAKQLADGMRGGQHRAARKGSGVEFAGHRPYTPGDDLRHLDRHSLLRHGRLMIREFYTDTERTVHVVVDATGSMRYRSGAETTQAPWPSSGATRGEAPSKLFLTAVLASAIAMLARRAGDPIGLSILTDSPARPGDTPTTLLPRPGAEAEQRFISTLEELLAARAERPGRGTAAKGPAAGELEGRLAETFGQVAATLPPGSSIYVLSDFLDFSPHEADPVARSPGSGLPLRLLTDLTTRRRDVTAAQVLDPAEVQFPFSGAVRLVDDETGYEVETDASTARHRYLENLERLTTGLRSELSARGAKLVRVLTSDPPLASLRALLGPL